MTSSETASNNSKFNDPNWWRQAAIYQIYPRSFKDSNGDGIGDINGITSQVDYLKSLSLDAVWLSPFYPSALADGGYDVDDYRDVDPKLGTLADFDQMITALHDAGIKVFIDIVPNHSSDRHLWFKAALASPVGSKERDRYIFRDGLGENGELPPNDWPSHFAPSAWTRSNNPDGTPGQWYLHLFAPEQPDWNWDNPEVEADFLKTLRFWADRGVDGFRVDVAHALKKDLSKLNKKHASLDTMKMSSSGRDVLFDRNEVHEVYRAWRKVFDEYDPPRVAVAEAHVPAKRRMLYAREDELGQAFNFDLMLTPYKASKFKKVISDCLRLAKSEGSSSTWVFSNHDQIRHATRYGLPDGTDGTTWLLSNGKSAQLDPDLGLRRARAASLFAMALPGCIYMYQGEELGLFEVEDLKEEDLQDPNWFRNVVIRPVTKPVKGLAYIHTQKGRDGCRVPLPWTPTGSSFGFGSAGAHLPQPEWFAEFAVEAQTGQNDSTLELYRKALSLRAQLQEGEELKWCQTHDEGVLHFARHDSWECIMNFSSKPFKLPRGKVLVSSAELSGKGNSLRLPMNTTVWIKPV